MWTYDKKLQYPVNIKQTNGKLAKAIITQYGGPNGELGASLRYLSQRISTPYDVVKGVLTDVGISVSLLRILIIRCNIFDCGSLVYREWSFLISRFQAAD